MNQHHSRHPRGSAILISIGITAVMFVIALSMSSVVISSFQSTANISLANKSSYASESGVEQAIYDLIGHGPGYEVGWESEYVANLSNGAKEKWKIDNRILDSFEGTLLTGQSVTLPLYQDTGEVDLAFDPILENLNPNWVNVDLELICEDGTRQPCAVEELADVKSDYRLTAFARTVPPGIVKSGDEDIGDELMSLDASQFKVWIKDLVNTSEDRIYQYSLALNLWIYVNDFSLRLDPTISEEMAYLQDPVGYQKGTQGTFYRSDETEVTVGDMRLSYKYYETAEQQREVKPGDPDLDVSLTDVSYKLATANTLNAGCLFDIDSSGDPGYGLWDSGEYILGDVYGDGNWYLLFDPTDPSQQPDLLTKQCTAAEGASLEKISNIQGTSSDLTKPFTLYLDLDLNHQVSIGVVARWALTFIDLIHSTPTDTVMITIQRDLDNFGDQAIWQDASSMYDFIVSRQMTNTKSTSSTDSSLIDQSIHSILNNRATYAKPTLTLYAFSKDLKYRLTPCNPDDDLNCGSRTSPEDRTPLLPSPMTKIICEGEAGQTKQILQTQVEQKGFIPIFNKTVVF